MIKINIFFTIFLKIAIVLKTEKKNIYNMHFTKGSIVAEFEVKKSEMTKDPEKALRHAIHNGHLSDLEIQPESLAVHQSYSGNQKKPSMPIISH